MSYITRLQSIIQSKIAIRTNGASATAGNVALSSSCGAFSTTSATYVSVTNLSSSLVTIGNPVLILLIPDGSGASNLSGITFNNTAGNASGSIRLSGGSVTFYTNITTLTAGPTIVTPVLQWMDFPSAGTYTYLLSALTGGSSPFNISYLKLCAFEIK